MLRGSNSGQVLRGVRRLRLHFALLASLASALLAVASPPALGACGPPPPLHEELAGAEAAFVGRVDAVSDQGRTATMTVLEVWKGGDLPETVTVLGAVHRGSGEVDRTYQVGRTYLVVPLNAAPPFDDSLCTATSLYRPTGAVPDELADAVGTTTVRTATGTGAPEDTPGGPGLLFGWAVIGMLALTAVGVGVGVRLRSRHRADSSQGTEPWHSPKKRWYSLDGAVGRSGLHTVRHLRSRKH